MQKEQITLPHITKDLRKIADFTMSNIDVWRLSFIIPITLLALLLGFLWQRFWLGLLVFLPAAYHIVRYGMAWKAHKENKRAIKAVIDRGDIAISVETVSHIAKETIYEPRPSIRRAHATKEIDVLYFDSGSSWRIPTYDRHYEWSKTFYLSPKGLKNIAVQGNSFFLISLQGHHDIAYVYPCNYFELDSSLK